MVDDDGGALATDQFVDGDAEPHLTPAAGPNSGSVPTIGVNDGRCLAEALIADIADCEASFESRR